MHVNPISTTSFKASEQEMIFADLKDGDLRQIAYEKAKQDTNDKFHRKLDKAIYLSLPLAGGLSVLGSGEIAGKLRGQKLGAFTNATAKWILGFMAVDAIFGAKHLLERKSEKINNFNQKHPFIANLTAFSAGFTALSGVFVGFNNLFNKHAEPLFSAEKFNNVLNNSKILNKMSELIAKMPSSAKAIGKKALVYAPLILIATQIAHMFSHEKTKIVEYTKNYNGLKQAQNEVRENIRKEAEET